jgi:amino acid adenylation domain-containing protein
MNERIFDRFLVQSRERPQATALACAGDSWTYARLENVSRGLAQALLARPASEEVVALYARRSPQLVAAMLACLRAGLPFAVLDSAYPAERLEQLIEVSRPGRLVLCGNGPADDPLLARLPLPGVVLRWDERAWLQGTVGSDEIDGAKANSIAYLLFTSGTTGVPKCIQTAHPPLVHFIEWYAKTFAVDSACRFSMLSGLGHDPVLRDVFVPVSLGATLHIPEQAHLLDPAALYGWLRRVGVTHAHTTPQMCRVIGAGRGQQPALDQLRFVFSGGDVLRCRQAVELLANAPGARVVNFYGATETPQAMGFHVFDATADGALDVVPIGKGIADVELLLLDDVLRPAAVGARGQIAIRTRFLSAGYRNDDGLTRQRFVPYPDGVDSSALLYLTGDVGVVRPDGALVAQGRRDDQVKIRGFRVELGDVVHHLEAIHAVRAAVVLAETSPDGENRLIAYLVSKRGEADAPAIKAAAAASLPPYMVPFQYVWVDRFPLLPNGKVDRQRLASLRPQQEDGPRSSDPIEAAIVAQWRTLLGINSIQVSDNFLDLGGDSLSFIRAAMLLQRVLGALPEGWEKLSIQQLAKQSQARRSWLTRVDSTVLLRAISITAIVAAHLGFPNIEGSVRTLFVVSGISFGKYLVPSVLRTDRVTAIWRLALRIALPTVLYTELLDVAFVRFKWQALLLLNNYFGADFEVGGFSFWYLCVLVQALLILAVGLAVPAVRRLVRSYPFAFPLTASFAFALIAFGAPFVWDTTPLFDHVPHLYLGAILLGWAVVQADSLTRRLWVMAATVATFTEPALRNEGLLVLPFVATVFLVFQRQVTLPVWLARGINPIAGASLFIYLTDRQVNSSVQKTPLGHYPLATLLLALTVGVVCWRVWESASDVAAGWLSRQPKVEAEPAL